MSLNWSLMSLLASQYDTPRSDDGPTQCAFLNYSVGMTCKDIYIAEHPTDHQGSVRVCQYLMGLKDFQLIWHEVGRPFGMVSGKERWKSPEEAH